MRKENISLPPDYRPQKKFSTLKKLLRIGLLVLALIYVTSQLTNAAMDRMHKKDFLKYTEQNAQYLQDLLYKKSVCDTVVHLGTKNPLVRKIAMGQAPADGPEITNLLNYICEVTNADWVSIFDRKGMIVAAAIEKNYGQNIVGKDYSDREFFQGAMRGKTMVFPRPGHDSGKPGLYYAAPIRNPEGDSVIANAIIGAVGIKLNQERLIESFFNTRIDSMMMVSSEGEIVFSNHPEWLKSHVVLCDPNRHSEYDVAGQTICHAQLTIDTKPNPVVFPAGKYLIFEYLLSLRDNQGPWTFYQIRPEQAAITNIVIVLMNLVVLVIFAVILLVLRSRAERNRFLRNIMDQEQKLRQVLNSNPAAAYVIDRNHNIIYWNKAAEKLTGVSEQDILGTSRHQQIFKTPHGKTLADFVLDDADFEEMKRYYGDTLRQSSLVEGAFERSAPLSFGPSEIWLAISAAPVRDSGGKMLGVIESLQDITALVKAKERAEAASKAKGEFLANMSHEIRTPMNAVLGFADMLQMTGLTEEQAGYVSILQKSGKTLMHLINDILDFSKIESDNLQTEKIEFDLEQMVAELESLIYPVIVQKNLEFKIVSNKPLPQKIISDRERIFQCLLNLVNNAIKFTEKGSIRLTLSAEQRTTGVWIRFEVQDTGDGIPEDKLEDIFEAFTQADGSLTRKYGGTGLGLTITRKLAQQMGGSVEVASVFDQGSTFTLFLPAGVDSLEQTQTPAKLDSLETLKMEQTKYSGRVLVAEDNPANQLLIQALLTKLGAQTTLACNGTEVVEKASATSYNLILMDVQMPKLNGLEATTTLRKKGILTPIVALTAHAMDGDRQKCLDAGCDNYLSKPIDKIKLAEILQKYLTSHTDTNPLANQIEKLCNETQQLADSLQTPAQPAQPPIAPAPKTTEN